ncbi:hypothetical protein [Acinetobacter sp.]|uniref:hypothetical protein n=1 Tax=Acinetobacter sp. TaxID=472 RepID=UPI000C092D04|nr:hypothetical protein [Acinetobacter sp.]MAK30289.1 hypothetical protein [Acinetobacter sp.]QDP47199.1 MAG: hypothetical protein GOVbin655_33 [Prokaryotic dsDNA virus sp.]|tara:strand:+ start:1287 stop:2162 length:876 start_codon:yes stop_codon:yes gene_type:complete
MSYFSKSKEWKESWDDKVKRNKEKNLDWKTSTLQQHKEMTESSKIQDKNKLSAFSKKLSQANDAGELSYRKSRNLEHTKQNKILTYDNMPSSADGVDGDIAIINPEYGAVGLAIKLNGIWTGLGEVSIGSSNNGLYRNSGSAGQGAGSFYQRGDGTKPELFRGGVKNRRANAVRGISRAAALSGNVPKIDYDSGWVAATKLSNLVLTHNLAMREPPELLSIWVSDNSNPVIGTNSIVKCEYMDSNSGVLVSLTTTNTLTLHVGAKLYEGNSMGASRPSDIDSGYIRVFIRK